MATSQRRYFIRVLTAYSQFPIGDQFITVKFYPRLYEAQLFSR